MSEQEKDAKEQRLIRAWKAAAYRHCADEAQKRANGDAKGYYNLSRFADWCELEAKKVEQG